MLKKLEEMKIEPENAELTAYPKNTVKLTRIQPVRL
jgi:hypothetical protein